MKKFTYKITAKKKKKKVFFSCVYIWKTFVCLTTYSMYSKKKKKYF